MKRLLMGAMMWGAMMAGCFIAEAQNKMDDQRMERDIEVAENVLNTLLRQKFSGQRFFGFNVEGNYTAGYGVTFRMPSHGIYNVMTIEGRSGANSVGYSYSYSTRSSEGRAVEERRAAEKTPEAQSKNTTRTKVALSSKKLDRDSLLASTEQIFLAVAKDFLADYGDMISQLKPDERIVITNRSEDFDGNFYMKWPGAGNARRGLVSAEAKKDDITQLKTGKITRDQFLSKLKIVNTETAEDLDPDLEVLSSMFSRLYQSDLSKTYYCEGGLSYERLKDFGVIYYMKVYSSNEEPDSRFYMPTVGLRDATQTERDKKVKELYPAFETELKENIVDYARTLRSLKDEEVVTFKVKMTRCAGCGIPETLEMSIKNSALKDFANGKANKETTLAKINVKKIGEQ